MRASACWANRGTHSSKTRSSASAPASSRTGTRNGRAAAWHESHNVLLQVAAELGVVGLAVFFFLIGRAFVSVTQTRRLLQRTPARDRRRRAGPAPDISEADVTLLDAHSAAMAASRWAGWSAPFFASVAYNWTFYYLLALAATPRDMLAPDRLPVAPDEQALELPVAARAGRCGRDRSLAPVARAPCAGPTARWRSGPAGAGFWWTRRTPVNFTMVAPIYHAMARRSAGRVLLHRQRRAAAPAAKSIARRRRQTAAAVARRR